MTFSVLAGVLIAGVPASWLAAAIARRARDRHIAVRALVFAGTLLWLLPPVLLLALIAAGFTGVWLFGVDILD